MKKYTLIFLLLISFSGYTQTTINNYKYVIVPEKFEFLKRPDQYKLNSLVKALLEDKGFTVYIENADLPAEIATNKCDALLLNVLEKNSMFSTNIRMQLKDCYGKVILETKQGSSREKDYNVSYNLAFRDAFSTIADTPYKFEPSDTQTTTVAKNEAVKPIAPVAARPTSNQAAESKEALTTLYAQPTGNGYQLVDTTPKVILTLSRTSVEGIYIATNGSASGIVYMRNDKWFFEYYKGNTLTSVPLQIKF